MQFGLILPNYGSQASSTALREYAQRADQWGFDSIWTTDHIVTPLPDSKIYGTIVEALITLAYLSGITERVRLGISTLVLPQRNPVLVAKQVAALDVLSGGRAMLSVGVGWSEGEYGNLGENFKNRGRRMDEAMQVLRSLFQAEEGESVNFEGRYYNLAQAVFSPPAPQGENLPIWVAGNSEPAIRRAAERGDAWHPTSLDLDRFTALAARFHALGGTTVALRVRLAWEGQDPKAPLQGTTEQVIQTLQQYQAAGLSYALIHFVAADHASREAAMQRFMQEVAPVFEANT